MFAKERQESINELLKLNGSVTTTELVERFGVSTETIRRDLQELEKSRLLQRVHGGAIAVGEMKPFMELSDRLKENDTQKRELSETAAALVKNGDVIGIDAGSTALCFVQALKERLTNLTVVTYSLDVFRSLNGFADFLVILCGGHFYQKENSFCGPLALDTLRQLHVQKAFVFPSAVSMQYGICEHVKECMEMQRQLIDCADSVYILADSSKFERKELLKVSDMQQKFVYVTDSGLRSGLAAVYKENQYIVKTGGEFYAG